MELVNLPDFFRRNGLLTYEQAESANRYIGDLSTDFRLMTLNLARGKFDIGRRSACLFIDWLFESSLQGEFEFCHFISKVTKVLSSSKARHLNIRTKPEFKLKGRDYFTDAISAAALCVLFGGTHKRILRIETVQELPDSVEYTEPSKDRGVIRERQVKSKVVLINGQYRVLSSKIFREFIKAEIGDWFVVSEHPYADECWTVGKRIHVRSSMIQTAVGIAAKGLVSMEMGRLSYKIDKVIREHRDVLRRRYTDYRFNVIDASYAFCDTAVELDEKTRDILRVELGRPVDEPDVYKYYQAVTGDSPNIGDFYKRLRRARKALIDFLSGEDCMTVSE